MPQPRDPQLVAAAQRHYAAAFALSDAQKAAPGEATLDQAAAAKVVAMAHFAAANAACEGDTPALLSGADSQSASLI